MEVSVIAGTDGLRIVEPIPQKLQLKFSFIERLRQIYHLRGRAAFRRKLKMLPDVVSKGEVLPNFGWLEDPKRPEEARIGGAVKLNHLRDAFGESREQFNVLYLVSSVLHLIPFPDELVAWARRRGIPVVWNQNGVAYPSWCGMYYPWFNQPMRRLIHQADYVFYQSEFCRQSADRYLGAIQCPSEILWNPVDLEHFSSGSKPSTTGGYPWRLLAMGTNHAFYRVQSSLDCLAALRARGHDAHLTLSGELRWSDAERMVREYMHSKGIESAVTLLGRFSQSEAPDIYRAADVLLHPKYKDPCPTVPIEAMACGLPVVGSRSGGMSDLVPKTSGELIDMEDDWMADHEPDATKMADAVEKIMKSHYDYAHSARVHAVASFDKKNWVDRHREIFNSLLQKSDRLT